jgi:hypothetical protein
MHLTLIQPIELFLRAILTMGCVKKVFKSVPALLRNPTEFKHHMEL